MFILLLVGFLVTRVTNFFCLPNVSGYILAGILIGPYALNIANIYLINHMDFISDFTLALIAFDVGRFLKKDVFLERAKESLIISLLESFIAGFFITLSIYYIFNLDLSFSLLLGAIATATAPASTMMTINQYQAKGDFVNILLQVVALDDIICLVLFSLVASFIRARELAGFSIFHISPLLACMVFGASYVNLRKDQGLFRQVNKFTPLIFSLFFVRAGINLDMAALSSLGLVGVAYFFIKIIGKYLGAYLGYYLLGLDDRIKNFLGFALVPQVGVSIGLAYLGQRILPASMGKELLTIILASAVLYELVGPVSAKFSLICSCAIKLENKNIPSRLYHLYENL